jgi:hypothetical protein
VRRALALLAAVAVIVGTLFIGSRVAGDDGQAQLVSVKSEASGPLAIVCITELAKECDAIRTEHPEIDTRVEDAATTAQALARGDSGVDGWLTLEPWPDIANELAADGVFETATPLASSPLVIAMVRQRENVLAPTCTGGVVGWKCLGDKVGKPWTTLTGGVPSWGNITVGNPPMTSATGLLLFGNAVTGYFGRTDISPADFDRDPAFRAWRERIASTFSTTDPFQAFVWGLPAKFSAVGVTLAEVQTGIGVQSNDVKVDNPSPLATAVVTLAPIGSGGRAEAIERFAGSQTLQDTLGAEGWTVGQIPGANGLPNPDVLLALSGLSG